MKKGIFKALALFVLIIPVYLTFFAGRNQIQSVPVSNLKDQLSSAQLSFFGRLASFSGSIINLDLSTDNPSQTTANLSTGDTLAIANVGVTTNTQYIVRNIGNTASVELASSVGTTTPDAYVIATRSAVHTVSWTPQAAVSGEKWQFLIKVTNRSGEVYNDGIPDQLGFDLGADVGSTTTGLGTRLKVADITCPNIGTTAAISVGNTVNITSGINIGATGIYAIIECPYAVGVSNPGTGSTMTLVVGQALASGSQLINPAPSLNHTPGQADSTADTFTYAIRQLDSSGNVLDTTFGKLAVTESVRVTAIVDPTITFTIGTSNSTTVGTTRCGTAIGNGAPSTTATAVPFGPLNLGAFNQLSQSLHCTTNGQNGYVIQTYENKVLTVIGGSTTIPDTTCEGSTCTTSSAGAWTGYANSAFGYSLEVGTTSAGATLGIGATNLYKPFGVGSANAQTVMSRTTTPSNTDSCYICYRVTASTIQPAGIYENMISFVATSTF